MRSPNQRPEKLTPVHAALECLAPVDANNGDLIVVLLPQLRVCIDVHLEPLEVGIALDLPKRLLGDVAETTTFARKPPRRA